MLFVLSLFAEFIANDKPFLVEYDGQILLPRVFRLSGGDFGVTGELPRPRPTIATPICRS